jgi:hypothetical protein
VIFSRRRGSAGKHARDEAEGRTGPRHAAGRRRGDDSEPEEFGEDAPGASGPGPYDVADAPPDVPGLDLGSLRIPAVNGVEVRVQASPEGQIQQVVLVHAGSALQLSVLAAPRSEGIWDEVRAEIRGSLSSDGVRAQEAEGEYGVELRARVRTAEGRFDDLRVIGIDGPRWMVRAVYQGPAAIDPAAAGPLAEALAGLVVNRGGEAMPVKDPLPLRLPQEMVEAQRQRAETEQAAGPGTNGASVDISPDGPGASRRPRRTG